MAGCNTSDKAKTVRLTAHINEVTRFCTSSGVITEIGDPS